MKTRSAVAVALALAFTMAAKTRRAEQSPAEPT